MPISKVVYGNNTLIDLSNDTVAADKLLSGYTAHNSAGVAITGTYTPSIVPTDITPSDNSPVRITAGNIYNITNNNGYAIETYVGGIVPSDSNPRNLSGSSSERIFYQMVGYGYAVETKTKGGAYGTPTDLVGNKVTETIQTGLRSIDRFILRCNGSNANSTITVLIYDIGMSTTQFEVFYYNTTSSANHGFKDLGSNHINAWTPAIISISGGNIVVETGANNNASVKNATWFAIGNYYG